MAVTKNGMTSGMVGNLIYRVRNGKQVIYTAPEKVAQPNSAPQMAQRSKWVNMVAFYQALKPFTALCFEREAGGANPYNRFLSVNMQGPDVYITKEAKNQCGGIVAPYWVSQGSLDTVVVTGRGREAATDIAVRGLEITQETTVGEFASAVVKQNERYGYDHRILFLLFKQMRDGVSGIPFIQASAWNVCLVQDDPAKLLEVAGTVGFASRNGCLAVADAELGDCGFCWVHTCETAGGKLLASPQRLIDNNSLLPSYMGDEARMAAMHSYGLKPQAFIRPRK